MNARISVVLCSLIAALAFAAPAAAQNDQSSPVTQSQYGDAATQFSGGGDAPSSGDPSDPSASSDSSAVGSLPFTGLDLALMAAAAGGLVAGGLLMRRRTGSEEPS
jgi:hypothetical protein